MRVPDEGLTQATVASRSSNGCVCMPCKICIFGGSKQKLSTATEEDLKPTKGSHDIAG